VAEGGSSGEYLPMLLRVPHFGFAGLGGYSLLGFGDIILPGLLVAYTRRLDLDLGLSLLRSYFPYCAAAYGAGLLLTYAALAGSWFGDQGQPALLYLVPCTLPTVVALGWARGQLGLMWRGGATQGSA
ncbi:Signal peptide peptidase-like 2, partial [Tetrabaena socialis]